MTTPLKDDKFGSDLCIVVSTTSDTNDEQVLRRMYHMPIFPNNRRLLEHRARNCDCDVCYREMYKLPPAETRKEYVESIKRKVREQEINRTKKLAKKEVKAGKQGTIDKFFGYDK